MWNLWLPTRNICSSSSCNLHLIFPLVAWVAYSRPEYLSKHFHGICFCCCRRDMQPVVDANSWQLFQMQFFSIKERKKIRNATLGDTREAKACLPYWLCFQFLCGASLYLARTVHIWMAPIPVVIFAFIDILSVICWRGHWYRLPSPGSVRGYELIHKDCHWLFVFFLWMLHRQFHSPTGGTNYKISP